MLNVGVWLLGVIRVFSAALAPAHSMINGRVWHHKSPHSAPVGLILLPPPRVIPLLTPTACIHHNQPNTHDRYRQSTIPAIIPTI